MAVTNINIPSQVLTYADLASFPVTGANNTIYIAEDTNTAYYWDGAAYIVIGTAGGNQDLQSVTDQGNTTTNDINLDNSAIVLENSSRLQSGTVNNGAGGGIARVCSIGYQDEWENGIQYFIDQNSGQIIRANSINNTIPGINDDITIGYIVGSIFFDMNTQNKYICTDNTNGAAVWDSFIDEPQNLQEVTDQGAITTNTISVGDLTGLYSEISPSSVGTASVVNGTYAYMSQDGTVGMNNGQVESALKNTNLTAGNNVILEIPDKTSGSYTISTLDDIPPAQVQSDWNQSDNTDPSYILNKPNITAATNYGLFAQTANSTAITGTNVETTLTNGGVGTLSVPANGFSVGDSFRAVVAGVLSAANNQTIRIRVKTGSVLLLDSGVQPITNITNDVYSMNIDFTIRALGAAGVASIVSLGTFHYNKTVNAVVQGFAFNVVNNTTFDTTISNTLNITVQWGSNNAGNSIFSDIFILNKIY
jgi:hypothetical protein